MMAADHEYFRREHKQLLTAQVVRQDAIENNSKQIAENTRQIAQLINNGKKLDERIGNLTSAIGQMPQGMSTQTEAT